MRFFAKVAKFNPIRREEFFFLLDPLFDPHFGPKPDAIGKNTLKNRHFFDVFEFFWHLIYEISTWPPNTW